MHVVGHIRFVSYIDRVYVVGGLYGSQLNSVNHAFYYYCMNGDATSNTPTLLVVF